MTDEPFRVRLTFTYDDERRAETLSRSLAREIGEIDDDRSRTTLDRDDDTIELELVAADPVALRAAINTWCSLLDVGERTAELKEHSA